MHAHRFPTPRFVLHPILITRGFRFVGFRLCQDSSHLGVTRENIVFSYSSSNSTCVFIHVFTLFFYYCSFNYFIVIVILFVELLSGENGTFEYLSFPLYGTRPTRMLVTCTSRAVCDFRVILEKPD